MISDRTVAWTGAVCAASVSVAINIGHAWPMGEGFVAFSACLPLLVLITAEQMARRLLGPATVPVLAVVGLCAYALSWWHAYRLLLDWGEPPVLAVAGALAVDGLAVGSVIALRRASSPALSAQEPSSPALSTQEPSSPALSAQEPSSPALSAQEPSSPALSAQEPSSPALSSPALSSPALSSPPLSAPEPSTPPLSAPEIPLPDAARVVDAVVWRRYDEARANDQGWTWAQLGRALGISGDAARKRAKARERNNRRLTSVPASSTMSMNGKDDLS